tara:strand:+ start:28503 stop:29408 length:906 start_codon:yes stop_codon:yes gene_type:complete
LQNLVFSGIDNRKAVSDGYGVGLMDFASKTQEKRTHPASSPLAMTPATITDHSARGVQLRKLLQFMQKAQRTAEPVQRHAVSMRGFESADVVQLARWRLESPNDWIGIDPENIGNVLNFHSGHYPVGTVFDDVTGAYLEPQDADGVHYPTGSYGYWRKMARADEQVDHFPPNAAYSGSAYAPTAAAHRPAFPIRNREGHRPAQGEQYGYGGHVSTTNSSFVQKGFTPDLTANMQAGDYYSAMRQDIIDKSNVALANYQNRSGFNALLTPGINLALQYGWITPEQHAELIGLLAQFKERPKG